MWSREWFFLVESQPFQHNECGFAKRAKLNRDLVPNNIHADSWSGSIDSTLWADLPKLRMR